MLEQHTDSLVLTHWGRVKHICVSKLIIIGSDNGLSPGRCQAIIWTNAGILLIGHLGTNFSEILIEICTFSFKEMYLKMSSGKWRPSCLGLNVLSWRIPHAFTAGMWQIGRHWYLNIYSDIIWTSWRLKSLATWVIVPQFVQSSTKKISKVLITGLLWGESTGDRWIPLTEGQ